ncbi:MAG TPA: GNAT family N-acetyltransferase [Chitinophagaceae bacterium]
MSIITATTNDIPALVTLMNSAFRGEVSKQGWTTEADLLEGDKRTDEATVTELMQTPGAIFLKYVNEKSEPIGCVFLQKKESKLYLGMLTVSPAIQAKGIGKQLMNAAAEYAKQQHCSAIFMNVISLRPELIAWYERQGYYKTGKTAPFPNDNRFGTPTQSLEFLIMEKLL